MLIAQLKDSSTTSQVDKKKHSSNLACDYTFFIVTNLARIPSKEKFFGGVRANIVSVYEDKTRCVKDAILINREDALEALSLEKKESFDTDVSQNPRVPNVPISTTMVQSVNTEYSNERNILTHEIEDEWLKFKEKLNTIISKLKTLKTRPDIQEFVENSNFKSEIDLSEERQHVSPIQEAIKMLKLSLSSTKLKLDRYNHALDSWIPQLASSKSDEDSESIKEYYFFQGYEIEIAWKYIVTVTTNIEDKLQLVELEIKKFADPTALVNMETFLMLRSSIKENARYLDFEWKQIREIFTGREKYLGLV
ncbi:hypothetical protein HMI54_015063 [Coelomomyces lativittatus]|nr:hypothetical protein HMI55_000783 [Coelomomyces lativittatus]KAJ1513374.1 hypothetical protein HMI54_015063 [Coelomomyces lativittatus]